MTNLIAQEPTYDALFGYAVSLYKDMLVVGAIGEASGYYAGDSTLLWNGSTPTLTYIHALGPTHPTISLVTRSLLSAASLTLSSRCRIRISTVKQHGKSSLLDAVAAA